MDRLIDGYRRFKETYWSSRADEFIAAGRNAQKPHALVIACADSRVDPQLIFTADIGQIFVIRNVANLVPPYAPDADNHGTSAALEFAVRSLEVPHIIVLGHSNCGGVGALLGGAGDYESDFIAAWMQVAVAARDRSLAAADGDRDRARPICEREVVKVSLEHLMTFPWVRDRVEAGALRLHGLLFDIEQAQLLRLGPDGAFAPV
jgi:carbonic anhydrase